MTKPNLNVFHKIGKATFARSKELSEEDEVSALYEGWEMIWFSRSRDTYVWVKEEDKR